MNRRSSSDARDVLAACHSGDLLHDVIVDMRVGDHLPAPAAYVPQDDLRGLLRIVNLLASEIGHEHCLRATCVSCFDVRLQPPDAVAG
jgi:hypothetical protein